MATHRISLFNHTVVPDSSGDVFFEPLPNIATNDTWKNQVLSFNDTSALDQCYGTISIPQNYSGTAALITVWSTTATTGNFDIDFQYRAISGNDTESLDQATAQETVGSTDAAPSAAHERMEISISLTSANLAAGDSLEWIFGRDGAGSDTIAAKVYIVDLLLEYADA